MQIGFQWSVYIFVYGIGEKREKVSISKNIYVQHSFECVFGLEWNTDSSKVQLEIVNGKIKNMNWYHRECDLHFCIALSAVYLLLSVSRTVRYLLWMKLNCMQITIIQFRVKMDHISHRRLFLKFSHLPFAHRSRSVTRLLLFSVTKYKICNRPKFTSAPIWPPEWNSRVYERIFGDSFGGYLLAREKCETSDYENVLL